MRKRTDVLIRTLAKVDTSGGPDACWPFRGWKNAGGYGFISEGGDNGRDLMAHRVVYERLVGRIPPGWDVCHHCDNPSCCNPKHLFVGDTRANMQDMLAKGRDNYARGERAGLARLTEQDVRDIRRAHAAGETAAALARLFDVSKQEVWHICRGDVWQHVTGGVDISRRGGKIDEADVREIRRLYAEGVSTKELMARYGLRSRAHTIGVVTGKSWPHVPGAVVLPEERTVTADEVREIRRLAAEGMGRQEIADRFGMPRPNVNQIVARRRWKHVD